MFSQTGLNRKVYFWISSVNSSVMAALCVWLKSITFCFSSISYSHSLDSYLVTKMGLLLICAVCIQIHLICSQFMPLMCTLQPVGSRTSSSCQLWWLYLGGYIYIPSERILMLCFVPRTRLRNRNSRHGSDDSQNDPKDKEADIGKEKELWWDLNKASNKDRSQTSDKTVKRVCVLRFLWTVSDV